MMRAATLAALLVLVACRPSAAADDSLHLPVGDPARKDKEVKLVLDGITDTRTGEVLTPAGLGERLRGARLVLVGRATRTWSPPARLRLVEELVRPAGQCSWGWRCIPTPSSGSSTSGWTDCSPRMDFSAFPAGTRTGAITGTTTARSSTSPATAGADVRGQCAAGRGHRGAQERFPEPDSRGGGSHPHGLDVASADHRTLFKSYFGADDPPIPA